MMGDVDRRQANAAAAHTALVDLLNAEASLFWSRFNAMLVAHSVLVIAAATILTSREAGHWPVRVIALAGFAMCALWVSLSARSYMYRAHYLRKAADLERTEGWRYAVMADLAEFRERMPWYLEITGTWAASLSAGAFGIVYVALARLAW